MDTRGLPAGKPLGSPFYRQGPKQYKCPVNVCGKSHESSAALQAHVSRAHTNTINPQVPSHAPRQHHGNQLASPPMGHISAGDELLMMVSPAQQHPQSDAFMINIPETYLQYPATPQSAWFPQTPPTTTVTERSMPPPPVSRRQGDLQREFEYVQQTWLVSSSQWPLAAHQLVRSLVIKYRYMASTHFTENQEKLRRMFEEFYTQTNFGGPPPSKTNQTLSKIFKAAADFSLEEMVRNGQLSWRKDAVQCPKPPVMNTRTASVPLSTPPTTPVISNAHRCDSIKLWDEGDADTQAKLFRHMIRNAKFPQSLIYEWDVFRKEKGEKSVEERLLALEQGPRLAKEEAATPESVCSKPISRTTSVDLKSMIQDRILENRRKRVRDKGEVEETSEAEQKRTKLDIV